MPAVPDALHRADRRHADTDDFASILMSEERREWQDPGPILERLQLKEGIVAADLGCGPGFFTIPLARMAGERGTIYAVDGSERMLHQLSSNLVAYGVDKRIVKPVHGDVSSTGLASGCADLVLFANVLHDLTERDAFAAEVLRIMKDDGRAVDIDWKREESTLGPPNSVRVAEEEAIELMARNGFALERKIVAGPHHYGLIFRKKTRGGRSSVHDNR